MEAVHGVKRGVEAGELRKWHLSHWLGPLWAPSGFPQGSCLTQVRGHPSAPPLLRVVVLQIHWQLLLSWLCWVFLAVGAFLELRLAGFSLRWLLWSWSTGSRHMGFGS